MNVYTTVCTALLVPFTTLCATFFAVIAELFATFLAVRAGPAWTVLAHKDNARNIENNVFMVLKFRNSHVKWVYLQKRIPECQLPQANRARK